MNSVDISFKMKLSEIQPSQLYLSKKKLALIKKTSYFFGNIYYDYIGIERDFELWTGTNNPGIALIAPFIGAALAIIGAIAIRPIEPREEVIRIEERKDLIIKTPIEPINSQVRYCTECGQKLISTEIRFCTSCGIELKF